MSMRIGKEIQEVSRGDLNSYAMNISLPVRRLRVRAKATILSLVVVSLVAATGPETLAVHQASIDQLEAKLKSEYLTIEKTIVRPPSPAQYRVAADYHRQLRKWQDDLAQDRPSQNCEC